MEHLQFQNLKEKINNPGKKLFYYRFFFKYANKQKLILK